MNKFQDQRQEVLSIIEQQEAIFALLGLTVALLKAAHNSQQQSEHEPQVATAQDLNPSKSHIKGTLNPLSEDIQIMSQLANANIFSKTLSETNTADPEYNIIHVPEDTEHLFTPFH